MKCCICSREIEDNGLTGFPNGHNPDPLPVTEESDRCCDACNAGVVLPTRLEAIFAVMKMRGEKE